jgi:hypothetical protein
MPRTGAPIRTGTGRSDRASRWKQLLVTVRDAIAALDVRLGREPPSTLTGSLESAPATRSRECCEACRTSLPTRPALGRTSGAWYCLRSGGVGARHASPAHVNSRLTWAAVCVGERSVAGDLIEVADCPRCGATMVTRHNRETGDAFLGCSRFPACKGTRSLESKAPQPRRSRLSGGGRPKSVPDYVELIVARRLRRDLTPLQGFAVQALVILVIAGGFWWLLTSGTFFRIIDPFIQWYAHTVFPQPPPSMTP